ncbi:MAG: hypothetical protein H7239_13630 [Flavobacterium sp.]|nr:hypothetical protein [Flavobacterium sp.]
MKKNLTLLLLITVSTAFSQQLVKTLALPLGKKTNVFQVVDDEKKQLVLFFNNNEGVKTVRLNENFEITDSISGNRPYDEYDDIIGYSVSNNKYYSYWASSNSKKIAYQCYDFENRKIDFKTYELEFVKEKPIEKITVNNIFYLVTILKNTSILNFYVFKDGQMEKKTIDLSDKTFLTWETAKTNLWELVNHLTEFQPTLSFQNILNETPASLTFSANKKKAYVKGNHLIFTFDENKKFTQVLNFDLNNFTVAQKLYSQPYVQETEFGGVESNSFMLDDKIVQMKLNSDIMQLSVKDLEGTELKTFEAVAENEIPFKNSEIIQENGKIKNTRILENSNQLLRKIYNLNPSISCYSQSDRIYLTLGSVSLPQNNNAIMYGGLIGGFTGALIGAAISSNYSINNLSSYEKRKVVYINCLFDSNFNHVDGKLKKLAFDQLRAFADDNDYFVTQTVFQLNSSLYYGGYNNEKRNYSFYKFND